LIKKSWESAWRRAKSGGESEDGRGKRIVVKCYSSEWSLSWVLWGYKCFGINLLRHAWGEEGRKEKGVSVFGTIKMEKRGEDGGDERKHK
jgi:hypothetical protein